MAYADRSETPSARIECALAAIAAHDHKIKAFCDLREKAARVEAAALDGVSFSERKSLHGTPVAVKEVFDVAGCRCGWGTPIHADRIPSKDSDVVVRLRAAGAVVLGTTTSTEYAMARVAPTSNPYAPERTPGASSSGSAAAVAARFVDLAIGSQTIGSGIRPAGYCGVLGLKPTYGAISLSGAMPLSKPLDHAVIMARDIELVEAAFGALRGQAVGSDAHIGEATPLRVGLLEPWFSDPIDERMWRLVLTAANSIAGGAAEHVAMPELVKDQERSCLETILAADMWRNHKADESAAGSLMSPSLRGWLARGKLVSDQVYARELARREELSQAVWHACRPFDVIATVATTGIAPLRSEGTGSRAPQRLWTLLGCPALAVPVGLVEGLPVAVQLIARPGREQDLIAVGRRIVSNFTVPPPSLSNVAAMPEELTAYRHTMALQEMI